MRRAEATGRVGKPVKQIGAPHGPVDHHQLSRRLAAAARLHGQVAELNPGTVLHRGVVQVDLEPVPDDDRRPGESYDVLHDP
jgi:hypothetical protein